MTLVKGPFDIKWGANTLTDISEISMDYTVSSLSYNTIDNRTLTIDDAVTSSMSINFLASDITSLSVILPQHYVVNGGTLSSGETVSDAEGAIDVVSAQSENEIVYYDLDVMSCGIVSQIFRMKHARTSIESIEFTDNVIRTIKVKFLGEPVQGIGNIQFFTEGSIN